MVCYQRIGWYPSIAPKDRRPSNMSDGAIFSSRERLEEKNRQDGFVLLAIKALELADDDPQIDFYLCDADEQGRRLDAWDRRNRADSFSVVLPNGRTVWHRDLGETKD